MAYAMAMLWSMHGLITCMRICVLFLFCASMLHPSAKLCSLVSCNVLVRCVLQKKALAQMRAAARQEPVQPTKVSKKQREYQ